MPLATSTKDIFTGCLFLLLALYLQFFPLSIPVSLYFFHHLQCFVRIFLWVQVVYPVGRKYVSAPSAPRLKLMSTPELKALFFVDDVKLPPWVDGM